MKTANGLQTQLAASASSSDPFSTVHVVSGCRDVSNIGSITIDVNSVLDPWSNT